MTPRQLESRIRALRGSVRRLLALHGLSWVLGLIVPLVILAGFADWLFHLDSVIRAALLAALVGAALYLGYRRVLRPLFVRFADLDIAMRIEERWPGLNDRLASTIQFLRLDADDDRYGSPALREATVRQAVEEAEQDRLSRGDRAEAGRSGAGRGGGVRSALGALLLLVAPAIVADRHDAAVRSVRSDELAAADASRPRRGPDHPQGRSGRFVHAVGQGPPRRQGPGIGPGDLSFRRRRRGRRAAAFDRRGRVPGTDRVRSISRSGSRSPPATIPRRSATWPSGSSLLPP